LLTQDDEELLLSIRRAGSSKGLGRECTANAAGGAEIEAEVVMRDSVLDELTQLLIVDCRPMLNAEVQRHLTPF